MSVIGQLKQLRLEAYITYFRALPIQNNKVIMWSNSFKQYGCSPKYITEYLLQKYPGKFDIVWVFEHGVNIPKHLPREIRTVRYFSLEYLKELHTAHYIICNMRTGSAYMWHKRSGQRYIQTWHSSLRLKKIEKDAESSLPASYIESAKADSAKIDLLISGCDFSSRIFRNSFWYDGEIMKCGTPRCDLFFNGCDKKKEKVCKELGIPFDSKILLYAPTFRNDKNASLHNLNFGALRDELTKKFGGNWTIAYRFHPNILNSYSLDQDGVDATHYPDMQELIAAADILVTDYSSCMFDMAIAGKPCFLYAPDMEDYIARERGLYFKPDELPFAVAKSNEEMLTVISCFEIKNYQHKVAEFLKTTGSYETGHASSKIAAYMINHLAKHSAKL